jgi:hypothetical protein
VYAKRSFVDVGTFGVATDITGSPPQAPARAPTRIKLKRLRALLRVGEGPGRSSAVGLRGQFDQAIEYRIDQEIRGPTDLGAGQNQHGNRTAAQLGLQLQCGREAISSRKPGDVSKSVKLLASVVTARLAGVLWCTLVSPA